jgi:hypothetical protein
MDIYASRIVKTMIPMIFSPYEMQSGCSDSLQSHLRKDHAWLRGRRDLNCAGRVFSNYLLYRHSRHHHEQRLRLKETTKCAITNATDLLSDN